MVAAPLAYRAGSTMPAATKASRTPSAARRALARDRTTGGSWSKHRDEAMARIAVDRLACRTSGVVIGE